MYILGPVIVTIQGSCSQILWRRPTEVSGLWSLGQQQTFSVSGFHGIQSNVFDIRSCVRNGTRSLKLRIHILV